MLIRNIRKIWKPEIYQGNKWMKGYFEGWYAFVPFMECYHGVLSFGHLIEGQLDLNGKPIDLSGGKGYIEKDWGRSFLRLSYLDTD